MGNYRNSSKQNYICFDEKEEEEEANMSNT